MQLPVNTAVDASTSKYSNFLSAESNTAVPVGPPRPSSITHPEAAPATVTCSYIEAGTITHFVVSRHDDDDDRPLL